MPPPNIEIYRTQADIERLLPTKPAPSPAALSPPTQELIRAIENNQVRSLTFHEDTHSLTVRYNDSSQSTITIDNESILEEVSNTALDFQVPYRTRPTNKTNWMQVAGITLQYAVTAMIGASLISMFLASRRNGSSSSNPFQFGESKARYQEKPETLVTFNDIAGLEGAKEEVMEIVDFLQTPGKYLMVGAKIPKGVLLVGPSGTGKTLLARAIAGEAGVPFFSCSASEFIEMFVGVGSSRVRSLFQQAKQKAPAIIFIDEIDAIGKTRGMGGPTGGGNDEREQTINQLLTEMDGFEGNTGVIVVAATNRADILDPALLRPGRFDRQIQVELPNIKGRHDILAVHTRNKPLTPSVNLDQIARITAGFSGADLENLANEAAIFAARENRAEIQPHDFDLALERIQLGIERKTTVVSEKKRWLVAIHEAGHALVALNVGEYDQVKKITIVPRGPAGGVTYFMPSPDRVDSGLLSRQYLENQLAVALGGRVAEELTFGSQEVTTGAMGDMEQVYRIARNMVTSYGFSDKLGPISWQNMPYNSESTMWDIDQEIKRVTTEAYMRAKNILTQNNDKLLKLARELLDKETLDSDQVEEICT